MKSKLSNLIEAMNIFLKYGDIEYPTHCEHDVLTVHCSPSVVSHADIRKLDELGFLVDENEECFGSFRFGSA